MHLKYYTHIYSQMKRRTMNNNENYKNHLANISKYYLKYDRNT